MRPIRCAILESLHDLTVFANMGCKNLRLLWFRGLSQVTLCFRKRVAPEDMLITVLDHCQHNFVEL